MAIYLPQHRHLKPLNNLQVDFPSILVMKIAFGPDDAFGVPGAPLQTTAKKANPARVIWNANEGTAAWEGELIEALNIDIQLGNLIATWNANELMVTVPVQSQEAVNQLVSSANHLLPPFLSVRLKGFVWIKKFLVEIGTSHFNFETARLQCGITIATKEKNQKEAQQAIRDWLGQGTESLRIVMAMYYYRHAMRLVAIEPHRQAMAAEVILNLAKAIEIVFSDNREQLRARASEWGFDSKFIESKVIPILLIRNEFDVAHVTTAPLSVNEQQAILDFTYRALTHINTLITRLVEMSQSGSVRIEPVSQSMDNTKNKLLEKIAEYAASE